VYHLFTRAIAVFLLFAGGASAQQPAYRVEAADAQKVNATISYEIRTTNFAVNRWMIFLPEPPELPSQTKVRVTSEPAGKVVTEKSLLQRKVRYIDIPVARPVPGAKLAVKLEVEATLRSRRLVELNEGEKRPAVPALSAAERRYYLSPSTQVDFDAKPVKEWLDAKKLRRARGEDPIQFAARVLEVIRADFAYRYDPNEDKRASAACRADKTDCGGMTYLFVAAMRANDTPARVLVGRRALPRRPGSDPSQFEYDRPHVRAEMFVERVGWVPVDPHDAHSGKRRPASAFVGRDPGDMLVLHVDVDLKLPFPDKVREADLIQIGPYYWTTGTGKFDGTFGPSGWDVKTTRLEK
jgi:transglutaminase-like putative cysteine protease